MGRKASSAIVNGVEWPSGSNLKAVLRRALGIKKTRLPPEGSSHCDHGAVISAKM